MARIIVFAASLLLCVAPKVESWQAIAHYQLGVDSGADASGWFQNLPDSWPSYYSWDHPTYYRWKHFKQIPNVFDMLDVTEWFAWSHGVQRTGRSGLIPNVPIYPKDDRDPGRVMYRLYKSSVGGQYAYETALGFLTHNAQDGRVHYRYFRGGSLPAWLHEHRHKEEWADCMIYQHYTSRGHPDRGFDGQGIPLRLPRIEIRGNPDLISGAQKDFIDSRLSVDQDGHTPLPNLEVRDEIRRRMAQYQQELDRYLRRFNRWTCDSYVRWQKRYDWTFDELEKYYEKALSATADVVRRFPR